MKTRRLLVTAAALAAAVLAAGAAKVYRIASDLRARSTRAEDRWRRIARDPGGLAHYAADNARLRAAGRVPGRVVFLGASITEGMDLARRFPGAPFVNRGLGGQLVWQQLLRMPDDVLSLEPDVAVFKVCAINFEADAPPIEQTQRYLAQMVEDARAHRVRPVLATVVPISRGYAAEQAPTPVAQRIDAMNRWIRAYAAAHGDAVLDYAAALADAQGYLPDALTTDGLHPNEAGYARMAGVVRAALLGPGRAAPHREEATR
jgi:acyl-CoA thioesterase-1